MPTYTYQCSKCGGMVDAFRKIDDRDNAPEFCEKCGAKDMKRMVSQGTGFQLKGAGWHATDYHKTGRRKGM